MTLKEFIAKVKELIKEVQSAASWPERISLALKLNELIGELVSAFSDLPEVQMAPSAAVFMGLMKKHNDKSSALLCEEINALCDSTSTQLVSVEDADDMEVMAAPGGGRKILETFGPLLISLLAKLLGG